MFQCFERYELFHSCFRVFTISTLFIDYLHVLILMVTHEMQKGSRKRKLYLGVLLLKESDGEMERAWWRLLGGRSGGRSVTIALASGISVSLNA